MKITELQPLVAAWARKNFPDAKPHQPLLGVIEEVGELAHAHLKAEQGIRGTPEEHQAAKMDAAADVTIFLCHYCAMTGVNLEDEGCLPTQAEAHRVLFYIANQAAALAVSEHLAEIRKGQAQALINSLKSYCVIAGFTLESALELTWAEVSRRDWQKNKETGV